MQFLVIDIPESVEHAARLIRERRDQQYGNLFEEHDTDARWVGEVGEMAFYSWAVRSTELPVEWILEDAAGNPDFRLGIAPVGVKTVKRMSAPERDYTAQITARHLYEQVDDFFFTSYELPANRLYLLGGISRFAFSVNARHYGPGARVHQNYTVRPGQEIYNIEIGTLTPPAQWLAGIEQRQTVPQRDEIYRRREN